MLGRTDSPWYPTMRLFRQETDGNWNQVFEKVEQELRKEILRHSDLSVRCDLAPDMSSVQIDQDL